MADRECECLVACPFFLERMADMPNVTALINERFCTGDWTRCARYRVHVEFGRDAVPADLFPDQDEIAEKILMQLRCG